MKVGMPALLGGVEIRHAPRAKRVSTREVWGALIRFLLGPKPMRSVAILNDVRS